MAKLTRICVSYLALLAACSGLVALEAATQVFGQNESVRNPSDSYEGLSISALTISPYTRALPGGILVFRCEVVNSAKEPATGYLVGRINGQSGEEDRRRIEMAPGETKMYDMQMRLASVLPKSTVEVAVSLNVVQGGREVMVQKGDQPIISTLTLTVPKETNFTALVIDNEPRKALYWRWPEGEPYFTYELAMASRIDASLSRRCLTLDSEPLPLNLTDWKSINLLVVASPIVFDDAASIAVMRQFLLSGGSIWIMLDNIETNAIIDLLPDHQQIETVETVELNRFEVEVPSYSFASKDRTVDRDDYVQMKRVIQNGGEVTHTVDGWPAAIWISVGRGRLLLTTVSSSGWIERRKIQKSPDPALQSEYTLPVWAIGFANEIHDLKVPAPLNLGEEQYPIDRIGNPVVSRSLVAFVLMTFCTCLIAYGFWHALGGGSNRLGVVAPTLALVASLPLVIAAVLQRRDIPTMSTALQFVQIDTAAGANLREGAAIYSNESRSMELIGKGDGLAIPSSKIETGVRSVITDDFQSWRMANSTWPSGTWRYKTQLALPDVSLFAQSYLTKEGLSIELPNESTKDLPSPLQDIVVNMVAGAQSLGKLVDGNTRLLVDGELPAEGERWTTDTLVNDEQRRRSAVYSKLFEDIQEPQIPIRTLCGWTDLWPQAPQWNVALERRGTALVNLPVRLATPAAGSEVRIPYSLIKIEHATIDKASSIFRQDTGKFISEATLATDAEFAFILPPEALPIEVNSLTIDWDIKAPGRKVRLSCECSDGPVELVILNSPSIPWKSKIDDARVLKQLRDGRLVLRIEIAGGHESESTQNSFVSWRIKHLRLNVDGHTLPRHRMVSTSQQ